MRLELRQVLTVRREKQLKLFRKRLLISDSDQLIQPFLAGAVAVCTHGPDVVGGILFVQQRRI